MKTNVSTFASFVLIVSCWLSFTLAVDLESVKEGSCIEPTTDKNFDAKWGFSNSQEWYHVIWSKYELYRWSEELSGVDTGSLTNSQVDNSCQTTQWSGNTGGNLLGFAGTRKISFEINPAGDGIIEWTIKKDWKADRTGKWYVTASDNEKYWVMVTCWEEGQKGYAVLATSKELDEDTRVGIKAHLISLGFSLNNYYEMQFNNCGTLSANEKPTEGTNESGSDGDSGGDSGSGSDGNNPIGGIMEIIQMKMNLMRSLFQSFTQIIMAPLQAFGQNRTPPSLSAVQAPSSEFGDSGTQSRQNTNLLSSLFSLPFFNQQRQ